LLMSPSTLVVVVVVVVVVLILFSPPLFRFTVLLLLLLPIVLLPVVLLLGGILMTGIGGSMGKATFGIADELGWALARATPGATTSFMRRRFVGAAWKANAENGFGLAII
jgi:hypothetical protein